MKKIIFFLMMTVMLAFTACSDDDEDVEPIVGTWILQSVEPGTIYDPEGCTDSTVRIMGDNTLTASLYFQQNNCDQISGQGTWEKTGASTYIFDFPELEEIEGTVTFPGEGRMIFTSENDLVFTFQLQL